MLWNFSLIQRPTSVFIRVIWDWKEVNVIRSNHSEAFLTLSTISSWNFVKHFIKWGFLAYFKTTPYELLVKQNFTLFVSLFKLILRSLCSEWSVSMLKNLWPFRCLRFVIIFRKTYLWYWVHVLAKRNILHSLLVLFDLYLENMGHKHTSSPAIWFRIFLPFVIFCCKLGHDIYLQFAQRLMAKLYLIRS